MKIIIFLIATIFTISLNECYCQDTPWRSIGPYIGYANALAQDYSNPDTLYAASPFGIYRTFNSGESWMKTSLDSTAINLIEVSKLNTSVIIAGSSNTLYKSNDYGDTWEKILVTDRYIGAIAIDPSDDLSIWVGVNMYTFEDTTKNLYHTIDGGENWVTVPFTEPTHLQAVNVIHFDQANDSVIYVAGWYDMHNHNEIMISKDKGATWTGKPTAIHSCSSEGQIYALASAPAVTKIMAVQSLKIKSLVPDSAPPPPPPPPVIGPGTIFILYNEYCTDVTTPHWHIYKSTNDGDTWDEVINPIGTISVRMKIEDQNPESLMITGWYNDMGIIHFYNMIEDSWENIPCNDNFGNECILSNKNGIFRGTVDDGIFQYSWTTSSWMKKDQGMNDACVEDLVSYPNDPNKLLVALSGKVMKTNDSGDSWAAIRQDFNHLALNEKDTSVIFAGNIPGSKLTYNAPFYCYKSENGGKDWTHHEIFRRGGLSQYWFSMWTGDVYISPVNPDLILVGVDGGGACGEGLYRSADGGDSWVNEYSVGVSAIAADPADNDIFYIGTSDLGYVSRSEDGGENWTRISPGGSTSFPIYIRDIGVTKNHQVFAATSSGLFHWEGSENWSLVSGLPVTNTTCIEMDHQPELSVIYVGTDGNGIYVSYDGGSTWESFNKDLGKLSISKLRLNNSYPLNLYAGTTDGGVWVTTITEDAPTDIPAFPKSTISLNIFPNPNSGSFNIFNNSDTDFNGSLKIINLLGQIIYQADNITLHSKSANKVSISNISSGSYVLVFKSDNLIINKEIIIK